MLDFTSALYLGFRHPSASLGAWDTLTLGRPAIVSEPPGAETVAAELAQLQGCEGATLWPSTLHLFWDLFRALARQRVAILIDAGTYPIVKWGAERVASSGVPLHTFPHHNVGALAHLARRLLHQNMRPIVVADGYCPGCNEAAPIGAYADIARNSDGYLVFDDTQALGILGASPDSANPYGTGGGGSLCWHGAFGSHIIVGSSLAKGFGAPLAVLSGSRELIERVRRNSETRTHCSPPSVAVIHAAQRALRLNRAHGDKLRQRLRELVVRLGQRLIKTGLAPVGGFPFPVQSFAAGPGSSVMVLHDRLLRCGVTTLLTKSCKALAARLTFLVTAQHQCADIDIATQIVARRRNCTPTQSFQMARTL